MEIDFKGTGVAMVTPFNEDKTLDYIGLSNLIEYLIDGGVEFLVSMGTTGESVVLNNDEKNKIIAFTKNKINGRVPFIVGIGGNNTSNVVAQIKSTDFSGIDAILSVSPAYNKPTQEGIYQHFKAISEVCPTNIILYNVPGRTSSNMSANTTLRLANDFDNIIAIKEASGDMEQIMQILRDKPDNFKVLSGDDALALPMIFMGAEGVISVQAMAQPKEFSEMVRQGLLGNIEKARALYYPQLEVIDHLFAEGNPAGVKACLKINGVCEEYVRLPLHLFQEQDTINLKIC
ncbi:MAG: 4-hydroxy-tetrahydrodipicolinate synthase [Bacteroidota bacterium]|nr:MAG: 4-hydroxy-tetrahydrodipicolinate synthase [Bacteroidota bacterium]